MHSNAETNDLSACIWMAMCVSIKSDRGRLIHLYTSWTTNWELRAFLYYTHKTTDAQYGKHRAQKENKQKLENIWIHEQISLSLLGHHLTKCSAVYANNTVADKIWMRFYEFSEDKKRINKLVQIYPKNLFLNIKKAQFGIVIVSLMS